MCPNRSSAASPSALCVPAAEYQRQTIVRIAAAGLRLGGKKTPQFTHHPWRGPLNLYHLDLPTAGYQTVQQDPSNPPPRLADDDLRSVGWSTGQRSRSDYKKNGSDERGPDFGNFLNTSAGENIVVHWTSRVYNIVQGFSTDISYFTHVLI